MLKFSTIRSKSTTIEHIATVAIILAMAIFTLKSYYPLYFATDTPFHLERLSSLMQALKNGQYPWYINYNGLNEYGYFLKVFYCDITLIPFALLGLATDSVYNAYNSLIFCIVLFPGLFMYLAMRKMKASWLIATLAAIFWGFCSYLRIRTFIHSSVAESFGLMFAPLVLWGLYEIIFGDYKKWYILTLSYSLVILTHLLSTVLLALLIGLISIFYINRFIKNSQRVCAAIYAIVFTILISSIFIFPFLEQNFDNEFYFSTSGVIMPSLQGIFGLSKLLGTLFTGVLPLKAEHQMIIGVVLFFPLLFRFLIKGKKQTIRLADSLVVIGYFLLFMNLQGVMWNFFPFNFLNVIQFTWRLFALIILCFSIASAVYIGVLAKQLQLSKLRETAIVSFFIVFHLVIINSESFQFTELKKRYPPLEYKYDTKRFNYVGSEYIPSKVPSREFLYKESTPPILISNM